MNLAHSMVQRYVPKGTEVRVPRHGGMCPKVEGECSKGTEVRVPRSL